MQIKTVESGRGAGWLLDGADFFTRDIKNWAAASLALVIMSYLAGKVPAGMGELVFNVLSPVFLGGLMLGCRTQDQGGQFPFPSLFAGFGDRFVPLLLIGVILLAGIFVLVLFAVISIFLFGINLASILDALQSGDISHVDSNFSLALIPILIAIGASVPLFMAVWFAPALIVLANLGVSAALKQSFAGCLANIVPFLVYGAAGLGICIALVFATGIFSLFGSMLAKMLFGACMLILIPVTTASIHIGYKEIFSGDAAAPVVTATGPGA